MRTQDDTQRRGPRDRGRWRAEAGCVVEAAGLPHFPQLRSSIAVAGEARRSQTQIQVHFVYTTFATASNAIISSPSIMPRAANADADSNTSCTLPPPPTPTAHTTPNCFRAQTSVKYSRKCSISSSHSSSVIDCKNCLKEFAI